MNTLYQLTRDEAQHLIDHFNGDLGLLAIALWSSGKASSIERGIYKAKRLNKFIKV